MPSPYLVRGDTTIIVLPAIALTAFDKERDEKKAMRLSCVEGVRAEKNPTTLVAIAFCRRSSPNILFDLLQKTSNNECSCAGNAGSASIHDQSFTSSKL